MLWLKDTRDVFGIKSGYVRGDSFPTMEDAKQKAASSTSAFLLHFMWMVGLRNCKKIADKTVDQSLEDYENGKPLRESTFKDEMAAASRKSKVFALIMTLVGIVAGHFLPQIL